MRTPDEIDTLLALLAAEDARVEAPPALHAAVLRAWDIERAAQGQVGTARRWHTWRYCAAAVAALMVIGVALPDEPRLSVGSAKPPVAAPLVPHVQPQRIATATGTSRPPHARRTSTRPKRRAVSAPEPATAGYVLSADPAFDRATTTVVRVRMPRSTLAGLGVPLPDPDAAGDVDVELLVGEDGVARTIRAARSVPSRAMQE